MSKLSKYKYYTPDGVADILPGECSVKKSIEAKIRKLFDLNGFMEIESPSLEFYDVFAAGEGFAPQEGMFKFFDKSGRILVLRYDGTIPAARIASTVLKDETEPLKLSYIGNMFRFNETGGGKQKEFTQAGIEILGPRTSEADAQAVELAVEAALAAGIKDLQVSIGDVEFYNGMIDEWGLDENTSAQLQKLIDGKETLAIKDFCRNNGLPEKADKVLALMIYSGGTVEMLDDMRRLVSNDRSVRALENLRQVYDILDDCGISGYVSLDLGMVQGLNYYTGIIFKGFTYGIGFPVFSGGRYDNVVGQFGREMSATGFSLGINLIMNALRRQNRLPEDPGIRFLVGYTPAGRKQAFGFAASKKVEGFRTLTDCTGADANGLVRMADVKGIAEVWVFDGSETGTRLK